MVMEQNLIRFCSQYGREKAGTGLRAWQGARIISRRVVVEQHNTWCVYSKDYASLEKPDSHGFSTASSVFTLYNCILDPNVAIVVKLEYLVAVPVGAKLENTRFLIGYAIIMPELEDKEFVDSVSEEIFTTGPGVGPTGELLWDPCFEKRNERHKVALVLRGRITTS